LILAQVRKADLGEVIAPGVYGLEPVLRVHSEDFIGFLRSAWDEWILSQGTHDALPLNWPAPGMRRKLPATIEGKLGYYSFDAGTPITAGTWKAAKASADVALTGAGLVARGERGAFALCRPPGHHAGLDFYGGYCFMNNAAVAAQALRDSGLARVAVLDVDFHHGNGTQQIFYDRGDVLTVSIHGDPASNYPFFLGFADEGGEGAGKGCNLNLPLPDGTGWREYEFALNAALEKIAAFGAQALVVSLGVDTYAEDPISNFRLHGEDFSRLGRAIAKAGLPSLFVMEGGYAVEDIGVNAVNVLEGFSL
jgi:acetoin utilization deacetylase AcuC-like enzyme